LQYAIAARIVEKAQTAFEHIDAVFEKFGVERLKEPDGFLLLFPVGTHGRHHLTVGHAWRAEGDGMEKEFGQLVVNAITGKVQHDPFF
jgi:hypothetical protein